MDPDLIDVSALSGTSLVMTKVGVLLLLATLLLDSATASKHRGVEGIKDGELEVGERAELTCKFIKWKQEHLDSISWSVKTLRTGEQSTFLEISADGSKSLSCSGTNMY